MREARGPQEPITYTLKAQTAGLGGIDPRTALLLWGGGSIIVGLVVSMLLVRGEIRMVVLMLLGLLGVACLSPRRGVFILTAFLPFMYFLRRLVLTLQEFDKRDPILLFPVICAMMMLTGVLIFYTPMLLHYFKNSSLLKACLFLMAVFALQIFNPLQGGLLVGVAGAMFFLVPMAWCAFGLLMSDEDITALFKMVLVIGFITALYGIYQHYWGLFDFELYELKSKQFLKYIGAKSNIRVMSTFASLGDFSLYLAVSSFISFAWFWRSKHNPLYILLFMVNLFTMVWMSVRSSFLLLLFSIMILLILKGRNTQRIVLRGIGALLLVLVFYGVIYQYDPQRMYDQQFSANPYLVHTLSGLTHPTQEISFQQRISSWAGVVYTTLTEYPAGRGLGSTTAAARKFEGGKPFEADSYFFELFYGSGLLAPILFGFIVYASLRNLLRLCAAWPENYMFRVCLALMCGIFLGSVFGLAPRDMIAGPLAWLILGWTIRKDVDLRKEQARPAVVSGEAA